MDTLLGGLLASHRGLRVQESGCLSSQDRLTSWRPPRFRWGFPGGSVVKNSPANSGDAGSITGPWRPTRGSLTSPSHLVRNRTLGPPLENHPETPPSSRRGGPSSPAWPRGQPHDLSPKASGVLTPFSPPSELPEIPVATREQSGLLCFHSR